MTAEQVVQSFMSEFETQGVEAASAYLADNMTMRVDRPPLQGGKSAFIDQVKIIERAIPNHQLTSRIVTTSYKKVDVNIRWTGTHTDTFCLSQLIEGTSDIPATGKKIIVEDEMMLTVEDNQITDIQIYGGRNRGLSGLLKQLDVPLPPEWKQLVSTREISWLIGVITLGIGIYVGILLPGTTVEKLSGAMFFGLTAGWFTQNCLPTNRLKSLGKSQSPQLWLNQSGVIASALIVFVVAFWQRFHPDGLSGSWLGWVSPVFPALMGATLLASVLRLLRLW